jgi:N6-L-threonylcarbamoyladenine synthase
MVKKNGIRILGIESSCDESAIALLEINGNNVKVEKNIVYSQIEEHKAFGGVVPEKAARRHLEVLPHLIKNAKIDFNSLDYLAVTQGPGLVTSLMVGIDIAKTLAWKHEIPLISVNHVYSHLRAAELPNAIKGGVIKDILLPALGLIVSGGHTELVLLDTKWNAKIIGHTRDDAAGEAFDKAARLLGLAYPGGPEIEKMSSKRDSQAYDLPRPMEKHHDTYDYSFSGLKNALRLLVQDKIFSKKEIEDLAASFQIAVVDSLIIKFEKGIKDLMPNSIVMGGGVSNNSLLRKEVERLAKRNKIPAFLSPRQYTGDNAAMIAWAGFHKKEKAITSKQFSKLRADPQLSYEK